MRAALVILLLAAGRPALADRGAYVQGSTGAAYVWLRESTHASSFDADDYDTEVDGHGPGFDARLTVGFDLGNGVRVAGFGRFGFMSLAIENAFDPTFESTVRFRTWTLGPSATATSRLGLYARVDLGLGKQSEQFDQEEASYFGVSDLLVALTLEAGYERAFASGWTAQVGAAFTATRVTFHEEGDFAAYDYLRRYVSPSIDVSIAHPIGR